MTENAYRTLVQTVAREVIEASSTHSEAVDAFKRRVAADVTLRESLSAVYLEKNCSDEIFRQWTELKRECVENYSLDVPATVIAGGDDKNRPDATARCAIPASNTSDTVTESAEKQIGGGEKKATDNNPKCDASTKQNPVQRPPLLGGKRGADTHKRVSDRLALDIETHFGRKVRDCTRDDLEAAARESSIHSKFFKAIAAEMPYQGKVRDFIDDDHANKVLHTIRSGVGCEEAVAPVKTKAEGSRRSSWQQSDIRPH